MPSSRQRQVQRRLARALIDLHAIRWPTDAAEVAAMAGEALAAARDCGDRLLEAEAVLLPGRWLAPTGDRAVAWNELARAAQVFAANQLPHKVISVAAMSTLVLLQQGEERNAIAAAQQVLAQPGVSSEQAATALYTMALAHGRLGELDPALKVLVEHGHAQARAAAATQPLLPARMAFAHAHIAWLIFVYRKHPKLWRGLPLSTGLVAVEAEAPSREALIGLIERAEALLPPGQTWPYGRIARVALDGLAAGDAQAAQAIDALGRMAEDLAARDPSAAVNARLYQAKLLRQRDDPVRALQVINIGRGMAEQLGLRGPLRDLLHFELQAREALQDHAGALQTLKQLAIHRIRSLSLQPQALLLAATPASAQNPPSPLRNLEPPHVRRALRFVDEHLREPLSASMVVAHSGVSRRTLEVAFKEVKGCTLAEHIRHRKLDLAATQLRLTGQTVKQVAQSLGFGSAATLSREFASRYGMTPAAWQRQQAQERSA